MNDQEKVDQNICIQKCFDVAHELQKASVLFKCDVEMLDLEILEVFTFVIQEGEQRKELTQEEAQKFFARDYEHESCKIIQAYDLNIWKKSKKSYFHLELSSQESRLFLVCEDKNYPFLLGDIQETHREINAQQAILGVIFKDFSRESKNLKTQLREAQDWPGGTKKVLLEKSDFYAPATDSLFLFTAQKEWELRNEEICENSSYALKEGQEAGRLFKSCSGSSGRNLLGEFIKVDKRDIKEDEFGVLEDDFLVEEHQDYFLYRTARDGFVGLGGSGLILIKEFSFQELNHRNIGNLLGGIECGFELDIKASSLEKDAIGAGVILEAKKIVVDGGVDQGVILKSKECYITGPIHQEVKIYADHAEISMHKGYLKTIEAVVGVCEGGIVECRNGIFDDLVGSEIYCKEAVVKNLRANNKIAFCTKLEIQNMLGGQNNFMIESSAFSEYREKIQEIQKRYEKYAVFIDNAFRTYQEEVKKVAQMKPAIQRFEDIFLKNVQQGLQTQDYIVQMIGKYANIHEKLKSARDKIRVYQERAEQIKKELEPISQLCADARLICHSAWVDQNMVEYSDLHRNVRKNLIIDDGERVNILIDSESQKPVREKR